MDIYSLSRYNQNSLKKQKDGVSLADEYKHGRAAIQQLESVLPESCVKVYMYGNHEDRWNKFEEQADNSKFMAALVDIPNGIGLNPVKWKIIEDYKNGCFEITKDLLVVHGNWTNIHAAKTHSEKIGKDVIFGHTHRIAKQQGTSSAFGYNIGYLADKDSLGMSYVEFYTKRFWAHGFAVVHVDGGEHWVEQIHIKKKKFYYNGIIYK